jgi:hypothetical protein
MYVVIMDVGGIFFVFFLLGGFLCLYTGEGGDDGALEARA